MVFIVVDQNSEFEDQISDDAGDQGPSAAGNTADLSLRIEGQRDGRTQNARGGPRTPQGKARSSKNSRRHGIHSPDPSAGGEAYEDYEALLAGMQEDFQPVGMYEEELVAHIVDEFWALHRVTRAISALLDLRFAQIDPPPAVSLTKPMLQTTKWSEYKRPFEARLTLESLPTRADDALVGHEIVDDVIRATRVPDSVVAGFDPGLSAPNSVGFLRSFLSMAADAKGWEIEAMIQEVWFALENAYELAEGAAYHANRIRAEGVEKMKREATSYLPDFEDYDRLLRYKRAHERSLASWIASLEASKRARSGHLDPPIRLQISEG